MHPARAAAESYLSTINAGDLEGLLALFAPHAVVHHPLGTFEGADRLREFYGTFIIPARPVMTGSGWVAEGRICAFELEALTEGRRTFALDHLTVDDDGAITRMAIAYRSQPG